MLLHYYLQQNMKLFAIIISSLRLSTLVVTFTFLGEQMRYCREGKRMVTGNVLPLHSLFKHIKTTSFVMSPLVPGPEAISLQRAPVTGIQNICLLSLPDCMYSCTPPFSFIRFQATVCLIHFPVSHCGYMSRTRW